MKTPGSYRRFQIVRSLEVFRLNYNRTLTLEVQIKQVRHHIQRIAKGRQNQFHYLKERLNAHVNLGGRP